MNYQKSFLSNSDLGMKLNKISLNTVWLPFLFLCGFLVYSHFFKFSFGFDLTLVFILLIVAYYFLIYKKGITDVKYYLWWFYLLLVPVLTMTIYTGGDMTHMIQCVFIMLLPIVLEPFVPSDNDTIRVGLYFLIGVSLILLFLYANFGFLKNWNTNCIGYLSFLGFTGLTILLAEKPKNLIFWVLYAYAFIQLLVTESRNVSVGIIVTVILLLFRKFFSGKVVFRVIYIFAILLPAIFPTIATSMIDTPIYEFLEEITENVYNKGDGGLFSGRIGIFIGAQDLISQSIFHNFLGYGKTLVSFYAAHNGYYLLHYTFGLIGTLVIAGALIYFFEINYKLIKSGDNVAFGCFAILISVLYQQSSEGWFLGSYLLTLMPFVYMAIVIKRYRIYKRRQQDESV